MSDLEALWIENNYVLLLFRQILNNMYNIFLIKKNNIYFFLNIYLYFFLFSILNSNLIIKVNTIIDIVATHYPDNSKNEFELLYVNLNYKLNLRFFLKILINKENLIVSINEIFKSAMWLEREIWDLFGIKFLYHNDLRRILTDYGFLGHPLLKQFPLIGFIELRYDDSILNIIKEAVEMSQMYRFFRFINPWVIWK
jgi:NADH:ubiquinone oxidoreductase subunit C